MELKINGFLFEKLKEIKELFKRAHGSINLLESKIASSIVSIKSIYQTHTPAVELALTSFKKKLPLTEKELREYIEEKLRREKLAKLKEKLKEKEEQEKEEKEVTVVE